MPRLWLALFLTAMFLADLAWIRLDAAPPRMIDDTGYLIESVDVYRTLHSGDWRAFVQQVLAPARQMHPPMVKLLPVPLYLLLGPGTAPALYASALLIPLFGWYLFRLARTLTNSESTALLAVILTCLFPLTYGLWRLVLAEFGLTVATVGALYHLVKSNEFRIRRHVVLAGLWLGWGLLWKGSFPLFVAGPIGLLVWRRWRSSQPAGIVALASSLLPLAAAAAALAGPFYLYRGRTVASFLLVANQDLPANQRYALGTARYWLNQVNFGISGYLFVVLLAAAAVCVLRRRRVASAPAAWFLVSWFLPAFTVLSFAVLKENRHLLPAFPAIGIAGALLLTAFPLPWKALVLLAVFPVYQFAASSFDLGWLPRPDLRLGPLVFVQHDLESASLENLPTYAFPAKRDHWPLEAVVRAVAGHTEQLGGRPPRVRVLGRSRYFSALNLYYQAKLDAIPLLYYSPPGRNYSEPDFLVAPDSRADDPALRARLRDRQLPYAEIVRLPVPGPDEARVYQRDASQPWKGERNLLAEAGVSGAPRDLQIPYLYVSSTRTQLTFEIGVEGDCAATYEVAAAVMNDRNPRRTLASGPAPAAGEVDLGAYAGTVIEMWLSVSGKDLSCGVGWKTLRLHNP